MRIVLLGLAGGLMLAGCHPTPKTTPVASESAAAPKPEVPSSTAWVLGADGVGPLKIGMTIAEVEGALGAKIGLNADATGDEEACANADVPGHEGLSMLFTHHRLSSLLVFEPSNIPTQAGIGIGSTEDQVVAAYKDLEITGRAYYEEKDPNRELTAWTTKDKSGIRFLTSDQKRVDEIRAGDESITWMEGCA